MTVFLPTLNQMAYLLLLIAIGFLLTRFSVVPTTGAGLLSKMENWIFIPALIIGTFSGYFTVSRLSTAGIFFLFGLAIAAISIAIALFSARFFSKDPYLRNIYTYGLSFPNFGFMGNSVFLALFPALFPDYLIFTLPAWIFIYLWGVPTLLMPVDEKKSGDALSSLKNLLNPMFLSMVAGILIGLTGIPFPPFLDTAVSALGDCMSPIAMLLTGMTVGQIDWKATFRVRSVYTASLFRLLVIPAAAVLLLSVLPISHDLAVCAVCFLAMPLGLNTIVVPGAYGKDTSAAAGMALISHLLSVITIPLIFTLFDRMG